MSTNSATSAAPCSGPGEHRPGRRRHNRSLARRAACQLAVAVAGVSLGWATTSLAQSCIGDCDGDGRVLIHELILGVNIALDEQPVSACPSFADDQGMVTISQLMLAINSALGNCPESPTPSPTPSPPPSATATPEAATPTLTPTQTATSPTVTPTGTTTPSITMPATATATPPTEPSDTATSTASATPPDTATPSVSPTSGAPRCGDGIVDLEEGETCDDGNTLDGDACPANCRIATCDGSAQGTVTVELRVATTPSDLQLGGLTLFLRYPENRVSIPGSSNDAAVQARVSSPSFSLTANDLDYALRAVLIDPTLIGVGAGPVLDVQFDICAGQAVPVARNFGCTVEDASAFDDQGMPISVTNQVTCSVVVKPPVLPLVCGDGIVNLAGGETCDDGNTLNGDSCPSNCRVAPCAVPPQGKVTVQANVTGMPSNLAVAGMAVLLDYPEGRVTIPGSSDDAAVQGRVTSPAGFSLTPNDLDYALRAVLLDPLLDGIAGGTALSVDFDICAGEAVPVARNFACTISDAAALNDQGVLVDVTGQLTCSIVVKPAELPLVCGDGIVNLAGGETCDDGNTLDGDSCPSNCRIASCGLPGDQSVTASVQFSTAPTTLLSGMTVLVEYPEGAVGILGSNDDAAVQSRVASSTFSLTPNDLNYALRAVLIDPTFAGVSAGTALTIQFDVCQGAQLPAADAFACTVVDATDVTLMPATASTSCSVVLP